MSNTTGLNSVLNSMKLLPWRFLQLDGEQCLSKFSTTSDSYCFLLNDLNAFYLEYLTSSEIGRRFEEVNPGVKMPLHRILSLLETIIPHAKDADEVLGSLDMIKRNNEISLQSKTTVAGLPLIWQFNLAKCDRDLLKEQLLNPLIGMVTELCERQNFLISLIKKKDMEIEEYKKENDGKYFETPRFDENQFLAKRNCPEVLAEIVRTSVKTAFDHTNDDFYTSVATAHLLTQEQEQKLEDKQLKDPVETCASQPPSEPMETEKEKEIARRKELEEKLLSKPTKKKKKIAF